MHTIVFLFFSTAVVGSPTTESPEWLLAPRLSEGQEFVYRGEIHERSLSRGVEFDKEYHLEVRALVTRAHDQGIDLAVLTHITVKGEKGDRGTGTLRLATFAVDAVGRLTGKNHSGLVALDAPTTIETGFLVEVPTSKARTGQTWRVLEPDRPPRRFTVEGIETLGRTTCVRLVAVQQSDNWDSPRADQEAWRRVDRIWVIPRLGIARRVVREIERRLPAHRQATYRLTTRYDLDSNLRYEGVFLEDRRRDIEWHGKFEDRLRRLVARRKRDGLAGVDPLLNSLDRYLAHRPQTPYRDALLRLKQLAQDVKANRIAPELAPAPVRDRFAIGRPAPDFVVENPQTHEATSLRQWRGKTLLIVFFHPRSQITPLVLQYVRRLQQQHRPDHLAIISMIMTDDPRDLAGVHDRLRLTMPSYAGNTLRKSYHIEATPAIIVIDGQGVVRSKMIGWGPEFPATIRTVLEQCLPKRTELGRRDESASQRPKP